MVRTHPILESRRQLEAEGFELLRGALLYPWQGLVAGLKRGPHMGCMMPSVEGMPMSFHNPCQVQKNHELLFLESVSVRKC